MTVVGVSEINPYVLAEDVQTFSELTYVGVDATFDRFFVAASDQDCIDEQFVAGGGPVQMDGFSRVQFELTDVMSNGVLCVTVNGTSFTTAVFINVIQEGQDLTIHGPTYIPMGVETTFNLTGIGIHADYRIKWVTGAVESACESTNHTSHTVQHVSTILELFSSPISSIILANYYLLAYLKSSLFSSF